MRFSFVIALIYLANTSFANNFMSSNYYCAMMNPQNTIIIEQLMGMWYVIEKIDHKDERHVILREDSCPVVHLSEEMSPSYTNSLHRNYNYGYNYGEGHGYGYGTGNTYRQPLERNPYDSSRRKYEQREYDRQRSYQTYPRKTHLNYNYYNRNDLDMKYLRLYWDDESNTREFHVRYNATMSGFWISRGPEENGASLDPQIAHFAGVIQVMKAVGNHLVLTFCHRAPNEQLYSLLLSRQRHLESGEVHGVHSMLRDRGLATNAIKKVCNGSKSVQSHIILIILVIFALISGNKL